jgi:hypothetical protein
MFTPGQKVVVVGGLWEGDKGWVMKRTRKYVQYQSQGGFVRRCLLKNIRLRADPNYMSESSGEVICV